MGWETLLAAVGGMIAQGIGESGARRYNSFDAQADRLETAGFSRNALFKLGQNVAGQNPYSSAAGDLPSAVSQGVQNQKALADATLAQENARKTNLESHDLALQIEGLVEAGHYTAAPELELEQTAENIANTRSDTNLKDAKLDTERTIPELNKSITDKNINEAKKVAQETRFERTRYMYEILERDLQLQRDEVAFIHEEFLKETDIAKYTPLNKILTFIATGEGNPTEVTEMIQRTGQLFATLSKEVVKEIFDLGQDGVIDLGNLIGNLGAGAWNKLLNAINTQKDKGIEAIMDVIKSYTEND